MTIDEKKDYSAVLTTTAGEITIEFTTKETPITVNNFVTLSRDKFYDNTIFHRVIKGFMIQGGDPKGNGTGGPGFKFDDEEFSGSYDRGTVAMANSGPNTNGSQFFIMHESSQSLPPNYVIFGKVTEGLDVVDAIATAQVTTGPSGEPSTPIQPVKITSVEIIEK
ncbi:peptidylprolyl isomerase [Candidatus Roizmanbacteria bacterium CG_4_10_14_0_2_um_filter_39_13]|uniref:Peptidyl-prolyl cis-trans isomerase n=1 Tax=Candidatus Roizmanbacteria bacterium CG_4_10_14_0_2_um_filter_39_13 TaxID=1974825 RepID=A0A2M7U0F3_9BACT|nr:MAG: peptidylprolyl isomerase [Candidatus Roizmanbacteria bacterium CG_4_10_14_0_2_um_filter_39_13]